MTTEPSVGGQTAIGLRLPTLGSQADGGARIRELAASAEQRGFDAVWCVDHLLASISVFGAAAWDPLMTLSFLAGATDRIALGVSVLIVPLRHPLWLLKELGTLSAVAGDRVLLGVGTGWDQREFDAASADRATRGRRLDEILAALERARQTGTLVFDGVAVEPPPSRFLAILSGGGSSATVPEGGRPAVLADRVRDRIVQADGWIVRSSAPPAMMKADLETIERRRIELGRPRPLVARATFLHVSTRADRERALDEQHDAIRAIGYRGTREEFERAYPCGRVDEVVAWLAEAVAGGADHLILHPVGDVGQQLGLIADEVLGRVGGKATARR